MLPGDPSPADSNASIARGGWASLLARACLRAAGAEDRAAALAETLDLLRTAAGAERAFLVDGDRAPRRGRIVAASPGPAKGVRISWTIAVRALHGQRPLLLPELAPGRGGWEGASVRDLALRAAVAFPVRRRAGGRAALVLDSRAPLRLDPASWDALGSGFAGLCSLLIDGPPAVVGSGEGSGSRIDDLAGASTGMARLRDEIARAAAMPLPALVVGASGTGKEIVARALHDAGPRSSGPFVAVNCSAIPEPLLERELFGAERGAYTGADRDHPGLFRQADRGTILLDEIGDMPLALQAKLLRVLQEGRVRPLGSVDEVPVDVRVVAATHRDLDALEGEGRFRSDLRYRLAVLVLRLPPLDERAEDIPALAERLLARLARRCGLPQPNLEPAALVALRRRAWPGNVRELETILARALVRTGGRVIGPDDLESAEQDLPAAARAGPRAPEDDELERAMIVEALACARGNLTAAAERIGWSRQKLYRRLSKLGLARG